MLYKITLFKLKSNLKINYSILMDLLSTFLKAQVLFCQCIFLLKPHQLKYYSRIMMFFHIEVVAVNDCNADSASRTNRIGQNHDETIKKFAGPKTQYAS